MAMIRVKPSTGPRIPSLVSLSSLSVAFDLVAAVDRHRNPEEIWKDPSWKAFRQSLQQVTFSIMEGFHSGKWHGQLRIGWVR
jgi:hypothetical protein